jgi:hypothetical protein
MQLAYLFYFTIRFCSERCGLQGMQCNYKRNIEVRLCNQFYPEETISITYFECVSGALKKKGEVIPLQVQCGPECG